MIRRKDLDDLFDTDPDLTGFDVDVSPYVRDADDTDVRVFWRNLSEAGDDPPRPGREELCAVSIATARKWRDKLPNKGRNLLFQRDPQWRRRDGRTGTAPPGWMPLQGQPWPGLVLLADPKAGGYRRTSGFTGNPKDVPDPISGPAAKFAAMADGADSPVTREADGHDEDPLSGMDAIVPLEEHLRHVAAAAESLCATSTWSPRRGRRSSAPRAGTIWARRTTSSRTRCGGASTT